MNVLFWVVYISQSLNLIVGFQYFGLELFMWLTQLFVIYKTFVMFIPLNSRNAHIKKQGK